MNHQASWAARLAAGLAAGGRWPCAWAILAGLAILIFHSQAWQASIGLLLALNAIYVALRLEIDRVLFSSLAGAIEARGLDAALDDLDAGLALALDSTSAAPVRALAGRIRGLRRWVTIGGVLALMQSAVLASVVYR